MKNWNTLDADRVKLLNKHFNKGRGGKKIDMVVIHHNAGVLSIDQIWQVWQDRQASAHYQVTTTGEIGQLVYDGDTAWHAGNLDINQRSIGLEFSNSAGAAQDWSIADKTIEEGAHLTAAVCRKFGLGRPAAGKNVRFHREFSQTSCPHHLAPGGKYHNTLMTRAQYWYDQMGKPSAAGSGSQSGGAGNSPNPKPGQEAAVTDKLTGDALTRRQVALALEQFSGTGKRPDGLPSWTGWDVLAVIEQAKQKLRDTGACTPVEALLIVGEDTLRAIINEGKKS